MKNPPDRLPVTDALPELLEALAERSAAVLIAPPGAGKTTCVPLALMREATWLNGRKIIVLEPRRIAARAAAQRMSSLIGEPLGQTVGIKARHLTKTSPKTRIEVVTEGVFTRMILDDPTLDGIGAILFDEFHERSIDADLGLALALDAQSALRADLRILVMSATLSGARVADLLGNAPLITSQGRMYPVTTRHLGRNQEARLEDQMADAVIKALGAETGSILAFLPGQGEIRRTLERLEDRITDPDILLAPLYGALAPRAQDQAIKPAPDGKRKVVLATDIAETSLTIEGVRVVIDSGLARTPRFEPGVGVTRLVTVRASRASVDQRQGRAGRTEPGVCFRLWDEPQTRSLPEFAEPEIRSADLSSLILDCADWGITDPTTLRWLDPPPRAALDAASQMLARLGALDRHGHITELGRNLRRLPLPPRLAIMVLTAAQDGKASARTASEMAAVLVERGLGGTDINIGDRLEKFRRDRSERATRMRNLAGNWAKLATQMNPTSQATPDRACPPRDDNAAILTSAYPDRIAKARPQPGQFLLANGRGAKLDASDALSKATYLVVADMQGAAAATRILAAAPLSETGLLQVAGNRIETCNDLSFDKASRSVRARQLTHLDAIEIASQPATLDTLEPNEIALTLANGVAQTGLDRLPWTKQQSQLRARISFLRVNGIEDLPDVTDQRLGTTAPQWLAPFLNGKSKMAEITPQDLDQALTALIPWQHKQRLDDMAPTHFRAPTGERHPIDYQGAGAPAIHIRVQELFGLNHHPAIADGRLPLTLNLLSPARRPIQITRDLPGFWSGSWSTVKAEMKGRYPKHPWPDDPANSEPTRRAKPRNIK
ncbi:MAG: ATP-dependent helicase HrpB [Alphaproteobacteria bacterium]|nr:ATP-dependent helicase HrpB [Alphaproteobacteria bacterium]